MKTKANESLFNKWRDLAMEVSQQSAIVQNDLELSTAEIIEYSDRSNTIINKIRKLTNETVEYLDYISK